MAMLTANAIPALEIMPSPAVGTWLMVMLSVSPVSGVVGVSSPRLVPGESSFTVTDLLSATGGSSTGVMVMVTVPLLASAPVPSLSE